MPEGHTIHHAARLHQRQFAGQALAVSSPQGRFRRGARTLHRRQLEKVEAHGKHLFYHWEGGRILHVHLGIYGRFRRHKSPPPPPKGAVRVRLVGADRTLDLHGPTACEIISLDDRRAFADRLGPDPLRADAQPDRAWERIAKSRAAIGTLLLDQSVIAGIGNVYRAELLYALRLHPQRAGRSLSAADFDELWGTLCRWMKIGARGNRIITVEPDDAARPRSRLRTAERLAIYKREHCLRCDRPVESWPLGGRTIYACTSCQV